MRGIWLAICGVISAALLAAAEEIVIEGLSSNGELTFTKVTNALGYRVEWAPTLTSSWNSFTGSAGQALDNIPADGAAPEDPSITVIVPVIYRVIATIPDPPPPFEPPPAYMVLIPGGYYDMGATTNVGHESSPDERPRHVVYVDEFLLDEYEVRKELWDFVVAYHEGGGYAFDSSGPAKGPDHPVHSISWFDAIKWCNARSEMEERWPVYYEDPDFTQVYRSGQMVPYVDWSADGYRLPSEAEWERAARGGAVDRRFPWSDTDDIDHDRANYFSQDTFAFDTSSTRGYHPDYIDGVFPYTSPVGRFAPNDFGVYDLAGNVWEWCWDWHDAGYYAVSEEFNPIGSDGPGSGRVLRGGAWRYSAFSARVANRTGLFAPVAMDNSIGFRCARSTFFSEGL